MKSKMYEVILSNIVTAASNPIEAVTQFCLLHGIPEEERDTLCFVVNDMDTKEKFSVDMSCDDHLAVIKL
jgi:hypothetical protein